MAKIATRLDAEEIGNVAMDLVLGDFSIRIGKVEPDGEGVTTVGLDGVRKVKPKYFENANPGNWVVVRNKGY